MTFDVEAARRYAISLSEKQRPRKALTAACDEIERLQNELQQWHDSIATEKLRWRAEEAEEEIHAIVTALPGQPEGRSAVEYARYVAGHLEETERCFESSTKSYEAEVARLREAVRVCGRHLYDCCRTDIDWKLQIETHDQAVNAVAWAECDEPYPTGKAGAPHGESPEVVPEGQADEAPQKPATSIRDEVRAIEGPLSPDELEEIVTRALDS